MKAPAPRRGLYHGAERPQRLTRLILIYLAQSRWPPRNKTQAASRIAAQPVCWRGMVSIVFEGLHRAGIGAGDLMAVSRNKIEGDLLVSVDSLECNRSRAYAGLYFLIALRVAYLEVTDDREVETAAKVHVTADPREISEAVIDGIGAVGEIL